MLNKKKILVIGGGFSGISCIKALKEEGHEPICYEKSSNHGGTWNYREDSPIGMPSIMPTTVINHSKEMGALSDFPPDKSLPNYMRHFECLKMFTDYGKHFDCLKHITFNREVVKLKRCEDYKDTGRWQAIVKNTETGDIIEETFDAVMVGVGQFTDPKLPQYPGMDQFRGIIMHTHDLKKVDIFKDKTVLVVGVGCSGLDAAVEISNVSSQVYLSTRSGTWVLPRVGIYGLPFDYIALRRFVIFLQNIFGYQLISWYLQKYHLNSKFNHRLYNLRPSHPAMSKDPVTNDILPAKLISGSIVIRKDVKYFTQSGILFKGETKITEVDAVILATGYNWGFPFLEKGVVDHHEGKINLYKCVFPANLKHSTLAVIGFILPFGAGFPLGEMQCRWASRVFSGKCKLPENEIKEERINQRYLENMKRYAPSDKMSVKVDYVQYLDELADEIGAKPNLWKFLFTDFTLFRSLVFGASLPYQYRLQGPHTWKGARQAILTANKRVRYPLSGDEQVNSKESSTAAIYVKFIFVPLFVAYWLFQNENSVLDFFLALLFYYQLSCKGFYKKYFFSLLILPYFITWKEFICAYLVTIFVPLLLALS